MYRCVTKITFLQVPSTAFPARDNTVIYTFANEFETEDSWEDLTNKAKITLPKNVYVRDENNKLVPLGGNNINIGGFDGNIPLFLRGDQVTIEYGYRFFDAQGNDKLQTTAVFQGFITEVGSKKPIVLNCEDNMYKLKRVNAPTRFWPGKTTTVESMLAEMMKETRLPFTVNTTTSTVLGDFRTTSAETLCDVLGRLHKDFHFHAYFRGNELRCGSFVYIEQDAIDDGQKIFKFQQNVISDVLAYKRKDDLTLSAIASNCIEQETGKLTKDGLKKTKKTRIEVLVTYRNNAVSVNVKQKGKDYPPNTEGERRTLVFPGAQTTDQLAVLATNELKKYYYTGLHGKFTTFAIPFIRQGDNVDLLDAVLPERNGRYKVKSVRPTGGVNGHRQEVELDYLITALDAKGNPA